MKRPSLRIVGIAGLVATLSSTALGQGTSLFGNRGPASQPSATIGDAGTPLPGSSLFSNGAPAQSPNVVGPNIGGPSAFGFAPTNAYGFRGGTLTGPAATGLVSTPGDVAASPMLASSVATTPRMGGGPFSLFRAPASPIGQSLTGRGMFMNSATQRNPGTAGLPPMAAGNVPVNMPNAAGVQGGFRGVSLPWVDLAAQAGTLPYQNGPLVNEYAGFQGVSYDRSGSILTLRGQVSSPADRRLLLQIANFEPGVSSVLNEVTVAPQPGTVAGPLPTGAMAPQIGTGLPVSPVPGVTGSAVPASAAPAATPAPATP